MRFTVYSLVEGFLSIWEPSSSTAPKAKLQPQGPGTSSATRVIAPSSAESRG